MAVSNDCSMFIGSTACAFSVWGAVPQISAHPRPPNWAASPEGWRTTSQTRKLRHAAAYRRSTYVWKSAAAWLAYCFAYASTAACAAWWTACGRGAGDVMVETGERGGYFDGLFFEKRGRQRRGSVERYSKLL